MTDERGSPAYENVRRAIERVTARRAAQETETANAAREALAASPAKPAGRKRGPYKVKATAVRISPDNPGALYYFNIEHAVAVMPGLSIGARGLYLWLAGRMSGPTLRTRQDRVYEMILGMEEICDACGISDNTARNLINELRAAGVLYREQRGANFYLRFILPLKRDRLRKLDEASNFEAGNADDSE